MNTINIILIIIAVSLFICFLIIISIYLINSIVNEEYNKIINTEKDIKEKLNTKKEIVIKGIEFINKKIKIKNKAFDEILNIKNISFKSDPLLSKCFDEIISIKEDKIKSKNTKLYNQLLNDYYENEAHIISLRTYYNKSVMSYNNLLKKIPYNIFSKFKKMKLKLLFDGKELEDII